MERTMTEHKSDCGAMSTPGRTDMRRRDLDLAITLALLAVLTLYLYATRRI